MKVLMIEPGKAPYEAELDGSLESMQEAVGGGIEGYYPYAEPVAIVCNDEGKINGLPLNRAIYNQDGEMIEIMAGTFFIAGLGEESFADLPDYFMEQYKEQFKYPEKFVRLAGEIVAVKQPLPPEEKQQPVPAMEEPGGDDIRLDESTDLAFDLDEFFRKNSGAYAGLYPDSHAEKECMWVLSIVIFVIVYGRMIEIYLTVSLAPIPFSTMANREWGQMGTNYLRSLFALGFQGFLIMVCVAIYAALVQSIPSSGDIHGAIWGTAGYTVLLAFALFKTGSLSKSIFNSH